MKVMCDTNDGFIISEKDLELRGSGDFFGTEQHGLPEFKIANLFGQAGHSYASNSYESGARFERELTRVIQAVYEGVSNDEFEFDETQVNIGSQTASSINLSDEILGDKLLMLMDRKSQHIICEMLMVKLTSKVITQKLLAIHLQNYYAFLIY